MTICVFASSSSRINSEYAVAASNLGLLLARAKMEVVFGGGGIGLMGKLADAVLENGGTITGVIPSFMKDEGWDHSDVNEMIVTPDMSERKKRLFEMADAVVALPGGVGTLEELTEAITLKQLGLFKGPIIILNTLNFYKSFIDFLENMISGQFFRYEHKGMWKIVDTPEEVLAHLSKKESWINDPRRIAKI
ncbi:MAG: TIGR00730 family Rossman fold protein [Bacteroidales bacterium]|nr:TIGR00730 family Rossman fold protein [Bacteroidales bacterium]